MPFGARNFQTQFHYFQTAENVLAQAELEGLPPETREVLQDMVDNLGFERRDVAAKKEGKQHVLQGQLLVLGDPRNGKTSLIKAMTGQKFDPEQNQTSGVEFKFVDRKWKTVELQNMKFGDFNQYSEKSVCQMKFFPRLFNEDDVPEEGFPFLLFVFLVVVLPIILGTFLGEGNSRWLIYFVIMAWLFFNTCKGKGSVNILLMIHFGCLATCIAYNLYGCSDKSVPMRLMGRFLDDLVTSNIVPLHVMNPWIFFVLELFSLYCTGHILDLLRFLLSKLPVTGAILLNFVFRYQEEVLQPIGLFISCLIFFAPIGLSCKRSSIIFPFQCVYIFLMHIALLYHQNILRKKYTVVIALELSIIIPLCFTGLGKVHRVLNIIANIILLVLGLGLHIYGKWLKYKHEFKGKSFTQVVLNKDFLLLTIQIKKALIDMQKLKNALNDKFGTLKLKILDFAGDEEYYAYHQVFLNSNALYVIVFNIQDFSNNDFKDPDCKLSKRLRFWLESIHSHVPHGTPIFLVGTHTADIPVKKLKVIDSCIRKAVWYTPFNEDIVVNKKDGLIFFHVENSKGLADKGVVKLRKKIKSIAENELKDVIGQEISLSWIKIQDAIIRYTEQKLGPVCVTVEDFKKKFEHLYIAWDNEMLKYFHKRGFIIYVDNDPDLSNWVLLKPDVLVQVVILLINQPHELADKRGQRSHWLLLKNKGTITKTLMKSVLSHVGGSEESSLTAFLEKYDLLCPLKHPSDDMQNLLPIEQKSHFVPSLLPMPSESQIVWVDSKKDKKFYIFFKHFLPEAVFYRVLSRACKLTLLVHPDIKLVIYRDKGLFWLSPNQSYCLRLLKDEGQIEVTFSPSDDDQHNPFDILSLISVSIVKSICKRDFQNLSFHCGPQCTSPVCPGFMDDSLSHFSGQRRRHVIDVYPTFSATSFKCLNYYKEAEVKYWLQSKNSM